MNGDAEKVTTNGDAKKDETEEETKEADDANETLEDAEKSTSSEKKKTSTKDKIKKKMSFRTMNFLKRKKKEDANESKNEVSEFLKDPTVRKLVVQPYPELTKISEILKIIMGLGAMVSIRISIFPLTY